MKRRGPSIAVLGLLVGVMVVASITISELLTVPLGLLPGEEGLRMGVYGFQPDPYGPVYTAKNASDTPMPYRLVPPFNPQSYVIEKWEKNVFGLQVVSEWTSLLVEVQNPVRQSEPVKRIDYTVKEKINSTHTKLTKVEGEVYQYNLNVGFKVDKGASIFRNNNVWLSFVTVIWDKTVSRNEVTVRYVNATTGQVIKELTEDIDGRTWGGPIAAYIASWNIVGGVEDAGTHTKIEPSYEGRSIPMYSSTDVRFTIDELGLMQNQRPVGDINRTLTGSLAPDSRMRQVGYIPFTLTDFGVTVEGITWITAVKEPSVNYQIIVYYLQVGKFTWVREDTQAATTWKQRESERQGWDPFLALSRWADAVGKSWGQFWSNPLNLFSLGAGIIIVIVILLLVFTPLGAILIPMLMRRMRRS